MSTVATLSAIWAISAAAATAAFVVVNRRRENATVWALFIFGSLSFYYTFFFTFSNMEMSLWVTTMGGNPFQKVAIALVLTAALCCGLADLPRPELVDKWPELSLPTTALVLSATGYSTHFFDVTGQWLIDAGSHIAFLMLIIGLLVLSPRDRRIEVPRFLFLALTCLIVLSVIVSFYEIATGRAWATYTRADGLIVVRASGLLFNPNLLGGWLGLVFVLLLRAPNMKSPRHAWWHRALMALIGIDLFLSGSRGATVCLLLSAVAAMVVDWQGAWKTIRQYLLVGVGFVIVFAGGLLAHNTTFNTLVLRWLDLPLAVIQTVSPPAVFGTLADVVSGLAGVERDALGTPNDEPGNVSEAENLEIAVSGRFFGELRDNGFLAAFDRGGPVALASLILIWLAVIAFVARASMQCSGPMRASMWALLTYLLVWSMQARAFQVYPIWLFMAIGTAVLLRDYTSIQSLQAIKHREATDGREVT
jgi:hypothetical protein